MIDCLIEKYLTSIKETWPKEVIIDIYVNPSKKEMKLAGNPFVRFIADDKNKRVYVWDAMLMLHRPTWDFIKKETNDTRVLYKTDTLFSGEFDGSVMSRYDLYSTTLNQLKDIISIYRKDWSWVDRYISGFNDNTKEVLIDEIPKELRSSL